MAGFEQRAFQGWGRGMVRNGPREAIPDDGLYDAINALLDDEGFPFRRGGSAFKSNAAFDGSNPLVALWDGSFAAGQRTVFVSATSTSVGVLAADDTTPLSLAASDTLPSVPSVFTKVGNYLAIPSSGQVKAYAGSRKTAAYATGTVSVTNGSRTLTGVGTSWTANVDPGMILFISGKKRAIVQSVESNTSLTLGEKWSDTTVSGVAYSLGATLSGALVNTSDPVTNPKFASIANRLAYSAGSQVGLSDIYDVWSYTDGNYLRFPGAVLGLANVRETLLVFTAAGMYAVSGLANATPSDAAGNPQWRLELANAELIAWSHEGIAAWAGAAIVPCLDGVWLVDPTSGPKLLSQNITDLWRSYTATSGYKTGAAAVHRGHYLVPILNGSNAWVDTLVCRLDTAAWTRLNGSAAKVNAFASRRSNPPALLGADNGSSSRVLSLPFFDPSAAAKNDHDGTSHVMTLETKDIATGGGVKNTVVAARTTYELVDAASDNPTMTLEVSKDGAAYVAVKGQATGGDAPEDDGSHPFRWKVVGNAKFVRFRLKTAGAAASAKLHSLELFVRRSGRQ